MDDIEILDKYWDIYFNESPEKAILWLENKEYEYYSNITNLLDKLEI